MPNRLDNVSPMHACHMYTSVGLYSLALRRDICFEHTPTRLAIPSRSLPLFRQDGHTNLNVVQQSVCTPPRHLPTTTSQEWTECGGRVIETCVSYACAQWSSRNCTPIWYYHGVLHCAAHYRSHNNSIVLFQLFHCHHIHHCFVVSINHV